MGLRVSKNKRIKQETEDPFIFTVTENKNNLVIKLLLFYGANPNILTPTFGLPALHVLCHMAQCFDIYSIDPDWPYVKVEPDWGLGCKDIELLIKHGADVNIKNVYGKTILHYCCYFGTAAMVNLLIKKGADMNCKNKDGSTPLHVSICSPPVDAINTVLYKVKILINAGADLSIKNNNGNSHYHLILDKICSNPDLYHTMFFIFLKHDLKLDRLNIWGQNCLHAADFSDESFVNCHIVETMIHAGISVNAADDFGNTPMHYHLCIKNILETLVKAGGDINARNNFGQTPLQRKCSYFRYFDILYDFISKYKVKVDIRDNMGKSLLHYFMVYLINDVNQSTGSILNRLLNAGCNVNTQDHTGTSCLHLHCIDILLEQPDVDVNIMDHFGSTPLHLAAWEGRADCVKKLLSSSGIDLNIQDMNNRTALDVAAQRCNLHIQDLFPDKVKSNFGPHLRIDASSGDIQTFIGYNEIELIPFLQECLECPDLGNIWNEEASTIRTEVDVFVKNLVKEITVRDPRLEMEVLLSGSVSEETKCGLPDEFDYMMVLTRFSDICYIVPDSCINIPQP